MSDVRTLGFWEETCKVYHENFGCSGMVLQYARVTGPLNPELVRNALRWLQERHPLLQSEFADYSEDYNKFSSDHYTSVPDDQRAAEVPLTVVKWEGDTHWQRASEEELATDFAPGSRYLWRARMLHGDNTHDFIFIFHHSISDGPSNAHFVRDFVSYCADLSSGKVKPDNFKPEALLPPVEKMIPTAKEPAKEPVKSDLVQEDRDTEVELTPWKFEVNKPMSERRTRNFYHIIDEDQAVRLKANTKREGVTINSVLMAAIMDATFQEKGNDHHALFSTAISLRSFCEPPVGNEHFGCYVMVVNTIHKLGDNVSLWDLSKDCHHGLRAEIDSKHKQGFMTPAFKKADVAEGMKGALASTNSDGVFPSGCVISNIGLLNFEKNYGPFQLKDIFFSTTQVSGNFNFLMWVNSLHGKIYCCLTYTEGLFTSELAASIKERFVANLDEACS